MVDLSVKKLADLLVDLKDLAMVGPLESTRAVQKAVGKDCLKVVEVAATMVV